MAEDIIVAPAPGGDEGVAAAPEPIHQEGKAQSDAAEAAAKAEAKPRSIDDSIKAAQAKVDAKADAATTSKKEAVPVEGKETETKPATGNNRDETGKFAAKTPAADAKPEVDAAKPAVTHEPPARFSPEAKSAWQTAPDPVKSEVTRAVRELEAGVQEHQKRWEPIKEYADLAQKSGTTLDKALKEYVGIDRMLAEDFPSGMQRICANKGIDIKSFAADVLGLNANARAQLGINGQPQRANVATPEVLQLQREIAALKEQVGGVTGNIQQRQAQEIEQHVASFGEGKPLFEQLTPQIVGHINSGLSLPDAYDRAYGEFQDMARLAGLTPQPKAPGTEVVDQQPQTLAGQKSIKGAPGPGSNPAARKPSSSIDEAIKRAMQAAGV